MTIGDALAKAGGRPGGFDYMRLGLSVAVLFWHSYRVVDADNGWDGWWRSPIGLILPMFFALSGFLVSGSLLRVRSIHEFLTLRAMRIIPALAVEVTLSAVVIGLLFTTLSPVDYVTEQGFNRYFLNILGFIHYYLPGVFKSNPITAVNVSLWTIPYELLCYLTIITLWVVGAIRKPRLLVPIIVATQILVTFLQQAHEIPVDANGALPGYALVMAFAFGVALYINRDKVPLRTSWALAALVIALALLLDARTAIYCGLPAAYFTVWLGLFDPRRSAIIDTGDYSYGIYLYAFPIQQAVVALFPAWRSGWFVAPVALFFTVLMAMFSWHIVEKPVLGRRKSIIAYVDALAGRINKVVRRA